MQSYIIVEYHRVYSSTTIGAIRSARIGTNTLRFALSLTKVIVFFLFCRILSPFNTILFAFDTKYPLLHQPELNHQCYQSTLLWVIGKR